MHSAGKEGRLKGAKPSCWNSLAGKVLLARYFLLGHRNRLSRAKIGARLCDISFYAYGTRAEIQKKLVGFGICGLGRCVRGLFCYMVGFC